MRLLIVCSIFLSCAMVVICSPQPSHLNHESILSESKKEDEKISKMSPEEGRTRLRVLAKKMDSNNDGFVDSDELVTYVSNILDKIDAEDAEDTFEDSDADNDNLVTWQEYRQHADVDKDEDDEEDQNLMDEDQTYFKAADANKDGKLNKEEFIAFKTPEHFPRMHDILIENALKDKDTNKDGFIDLNEFLAQNSGEHNSEWVIAERSRFNDQYDKNKDGRLDKKEMEQWLIPDDQETAREESGHLMGEADKNHDGKLSYDEIESEYDLFATSEATNYGADLESMSHDEL